MTDRYRPFTEDELKNGSAEGDDGAEKIAKAREIWKSAIPVHGTDADKYLALRGYRSAVSPDGCRPLA